MKRSASITLIALTLGIFIPTFSSAAPKTGTICSTKGKVQSYKGYEFTCLKKSGKLIWSKGVLIKKANSSIANPSPSPTTSKQPYLFESLCAADPQVPEEWRAMEAYMLSIKACSAALRIVEKQMPLAKPKSNLTEEVNLADVSTCRIENLKPNATYLGFPKATDIKAVEAFLERRHPSSDTTFQIIPVTGLDAPDRGTTPKQDYQKYFDYVKNWIEYNSDFGANVEFRIPNKYFYVPVTIGDYQLIHAPSDKAFAQGKRREFMTEVIKVVDKEINFRDADITIVVVPAGTSLDVIQQTVTGWVMTDEGPLNRITAVAPDTTTLGKNRPLANLNHPIFWLHELFHVGLGLDDHYGDQQWNYGNHGTGMWTLMSTGQTELATWHKWLVGFLHDSQVRCAKPNNSSTHWLSPTTFKTKNDKLLVIPVSKTKAIVVESMRMGGLNYKIPPESEGALVYLLDMEKIEHGFGMELKLPDGRNAPSQAAQKPFFMANAPFKLNESIVIEGHKITVIESGEFGDVIRVEKI